MLTELGAIKSVGLLFFWFCWGTGVWWVAVFFDGWLLFGMVGAGGGRYLCFVGGGEDDCFRIR